MGRLQPENGSHNIARADGARAKVVALELSLIRTIRDWREKWQGLGLRWKNLTGHVENSLFVGHIDVSKAVLSPAPSCAGKRHELPEQGRWVGGREFRQREPPMGM